MTIKGHPVHMMLVHFPSALLPVGVIGNWVGYYYPSSLISNYSFTSLLLGTAMGWLAAIFGGLEVIRWYADKKPPSSLNKAIWHGSLHLFFLTLFTIMCLRQAKTFPEIVSPSISVIGMQSMLLLGVLVANFIGGELVLKHFHSHGKTCNN